MADLTYTASATERKAQTGLVPGKGEGSSVKQLLCSTIEIAASASAGSTYKLGRIPSNARLLPVGLIATDDLSTGTTTIDIGLASVDSNITSDPNAIIDGIDVTSAVSTNLVLETADNSGKQAWEFVNGQTSDPGGELDVYASVADAAVSTAGGTLTMVLNGYFD